MSENDQIVLLWMRETEDSSNQLSKFFFKEVPPYKTFFRWIPDINPVDLENLACQVYNHAGQLIKAGLWFSLLAKHSQTDRKRDRPKGNMSPILETELNFKARNMWAVAAKWNSNSWTAHSLPCKIKLRDLMKEILRWLWCNPHHARILCSSESDKKRNGVQQRQELHNRPCRR